jgi:circadian clock protein KaiC
MQRLITGVRGLDEVLGGGIPELSAVIVAGAPGSGKTVLVQNILYSCEGADTALYISTMSEPQLKVLRYQQGFSFFQTEKFMTKVIYEDIAAHMQEDGGMAIRAIEAAVSRHAPKLLVIDSFRAVLDLTRNPLDRRRLVYDLALRMSVWGCTIILVGEYAEDEILTRTEFAVVDGILFLYGTEESKVQRRYMRVMKMRGTSTLQGEHSMSITRAGVGIHPRRAPVAATQVYSEGLRSRQPTGVSGLDGMLSGGIPEGSTTILSGPTGCGKSLTAISWLVHGARQGEPGLLISYDSPPGSILRHTERFPWNLHELQQQGLLHIVYISPVEVKLASDLDDISHLVLSNGIRRTVVDSITSLELGIQDRVSFTDYLWGLADWFKLSASSLLMVAEQVYSPESREGLGFSYLSDNIVTYEYRAEGPRLASYVRVLKMRGSHHDTLRRQFVVTESGPQVAQECSAAAVSDTCLTR